MNRRQFFGNMIGGVATCAAVRTWPFRVFSFPSEVKIANWYDFPEAFTLGNVPPIHLDPGIWSQIKTVGFFNGFEGTYLDPEVCEAALDCERNEVGWSAEEAEKHWRERA